MLSVYCSGSIAKGASDEKKLCWSDRERSAVAEGARGAELIFLNPDDPIPDPGNTLGQFGRDMYQIMVASAVLVDARERRGLGIGVEMAAAASMGVPVVVIAPRNSKYRLDRLEYRGSVIDDYVHPHVAVLAQDIVEDFVSAGAVLSSLSPAHKGDRREQVPAWLEAAIVEYEQNVLSLDPPMLAALTRLDS